MKLFPYWPYLLAPTALYYFGYFQNVLVITANQGTMPVHFPHAFWSAVATSNLHVSAGTLVDAVHRVMQPSDHLKWLADWIQLRGVGTASPGDMAIWLGETTKWPGIAAYLALVWRGNKV
jgi:hypothetical protein